MIACYTVARGKIQFKGESSLAVLQKMPSCSDENTLCDSSLDGLPRSRLLPLRAHNHAHLTAHDCACAEGEEPGSRLSGSESTSVKSEVTVLVLLVPPLLLALAAFAI